MKPQLLTAAGALNLLLLTSNAFALDEHILVKPGDGHVAVTAEKTDRGHVRIVVTRDPAKNPDKTRQGWLTVSDEAGLLAECPVESKERDGHMTFSFELAPAAVRQSKFTLNEIVLDKEGHPQVGGATILEVRIADFSTSTQALRGNP